MTATKEKASARKESPGSLAHPVLPHMQLLAIEMVMSAANRHPALDERGNLDVPLHASDKIIANFHPQDRQVIAVVRLEVVAKDGKAKLAEWSAVYRLAYQVADAFQGDRVKERAEAFCQSYSLAHAWPYWREHLASMCIRMGLPTILAPLLIVGATPVVQPRIPAKSRK